MQYSSRFLELNIPDSFLNINKIPDATKFITVTYICLTATLFCIRRSLYNKLVLEDPNLDYNLISSPLFANGTFADLEVPHLISSIQLHRH
ncbi:CLN_G0048310.mRNA.1.CDS.1 [Saccharomyces cerevisiae]|nr:CLN_G0048310.mRNA.1.CDS.1 [Saccharomyces cerevisiae]CAI7454199.1 CLN_G0048310.mRNA.1.CDS.1 [Saccharomyces cerevisiae]